MSADKRARIVDINLTPVAFADPPLLNAVGVHEPFAIRTIIEIVTDTGMYGLGETYGDEAHQNRLQLAADALNGTDVFDINRARAAVDEADRKSVV